MPSYIYTLQRTFDLLGWSVSGCTRALWRMDKPQCDCVSKFKDMVIGRVTGAEQRNDWETRTMLLQCLGPFVGKIP